jgi:hypothetical protein
MRKLAILVLVACVAAPLSAQIPSNPAPYKDPGTGTIIGAVFPGGGQYYAGETGKGLVITGIAFAAPIVGALMTTDDILNCTSLECTVDKGTMLPLWVGAGVGLGAWLYGIIDAAPAARRANERNGVPVAQLLPYVDPISHRAGLTIRFSLAL